MRSSTGISWICGGWRWSQSTPVGRSNARARPRSRLAASRSGRPGCRARRWGGSRSGSGSGGPWWRSRSCPRPCRVSASSAYSRSEKPPPLPIRAPFRLTATEPVRIRSSFGHLLEVEHLAVPERALDRRRLAQLLLGQLRRVEQPERMIVAQPRDGHHERLALLEREPAGVGLGRVGVRLDRLGALPGRMCRAAARRQPARRRSSGSGPGRPGKRETPSRSIAFQTERRMASLDLTRPSYQRISANTCAVIRGNSA